jgi:ABC-2 type transport system ATP-binding protein
MKRHIALNPGLLLTARCFSVLRHIRTLHPRGGTPPLIQLRQLTRLFDDQRAVDRIDLVIPEGQIFGLLGPNGAGKTTTIKMLTGMLRISAGSATVFGHDVATDPLAVKRIIGYVPESGAVFETLTAREYLALVAALHRMPRDEAGRQIERFTQFFDLDGKTIDEKPMSAFSKGMRQKVVIIAALLHGPRAIFFDEPLNGLDANACLQVKTLIASLAREGRTIVYCSHILDVVERLCERIVILHEGHVIADGAAAALCAEHGVASLELLFNRLTGTENQLARAEEFARAIGPLDVPNPFDTADPSGSVEPGER